MTLIDAGGGGGLSDIIRKRIKKPAPAPQPDAFAGLKPIGDALGNVGGAIGGALGEARKMPVIGGALDVLGAVGDATVSTPVGLAALGADSLLGTGLGGAAGRANAGRPFWELPKTAFQLTRGALGEVASDASQDPKARLLAGLAGTTADVGGFVAPIPGAGFLGRLGRLGARGANRLPSVIERSVGDAAPGAGMFGSREAAAISAGREAPRLTPPRLTTDATLAADLQASLDAAAAKKPGIADDATFRTKIAEAQARMYASQVPQAELANRMPVSRTDPGGGIYARPIASKVASGADLSRLPKSVRVADQAAADAGKVSPSGDVAVADTSLHDALAASLRAKGRPDLIVGETKPKSDFVGTSPRRSAVHDANEAAIAALRSGDMAGLEKALTAVKESGGSLDHTAARIRAAGLPGPTRGELAAIKRKPALTDSAIRGEAFRTRAKAPDLVAPAPAPAVAPARSNVVPIFDMARERAMAKDLNIERATADQLRRDIAARRAAPPPPPPPTPPTTTGGAQPPLPPASGLDKFLSVWNVPKALKASLDLSAPFRQGILLAAGHPGEFFGAFKPMIRSLTDSKYAQTLDTQIRSVDRPGLYLAPLDSAKLGAREEAFMSSFANKLPGVSASNRAYVTFLNKLRADVYDNVLDGWTSGGKAVSEADRLGLANVINHFTGRGDLPRMADSAGAFLNGMFFSPRFVVSRFQSVGDALGVLKSPGSLAAREAASSMAKFVGAGLTVLTLAKLAGYKVEDDPRSSGFGKIQIGNQTVDIWGGEQQVARYAAQVITGQAKTLTGKNAGQIRDVPRDQTIGRFVRSKLSPTTGKVNDVFGFVGGGGPTAKDRQANAGLPFMAQTIGRNLIGQPVKPDGSLINPFDSQSLTSPLGLADTIQSAQQGSPLGALSLLGFGVQTPDAPAAGGSAPTAPSGSTPRLVPPGAAGGTPRLVPPRSTGGTGSPRLVPPRVGGTGTPRLVPPRAVLTPPSGAGGRQPALMVPQTQGLVPPQPQGDVRSTISSAAQRAGIDPRLALAVGIVESNLNPAAVGDNGESHGVFQERLVYGRGGFTTPDPDPARQTERFAADVRRLLASGFRGSVGDLAAAVQRPYDPADYARKVNAAYQSLP